MRSRLGYVWWWWRGVSHDMVGLKETFSSQRKETGVGRIAEQRAGEIAGFVGIYI